MRICIRSTVHSFVPKNVKDAEQVEGAQPEGQYQNIYGLVEYEGNRTNWQKNLDIQLA